MTEDGEHLVCRITDINVAATGVYAIDYVEQEQYVNRKTLFVRNVFNEGKRLSQVDVLAYRGRLVDVVMSQGRITSIRELD
jgi:hypothetical protein